MDKMLFDNNDTVVTLLWTMDRICICIFFGVAIVLFLCFSTVIGELKIIINYLNYLNAML